MLGVIFFFIVLFVLSNLVEMEGIGGVCVLGDDNYVLFLFEELFVVLFVLFEEEFMM